ncbi:U3 small nucleolar ribonucleoprotein protein MPP10 [Cricetulus griseus]|uniref:U3 small nucleolar ribonucleoprotein protein MPP10 n=1 Tax=Cricetulus griseus TaxID=10029 RepID=A0A061IAD5_CRIGR|nr:U3 small nucleolar ribonucleoprotein protein MPP10 [Cricetulus griseus]XP_027263878.1 U3 small nucleolar ribonucleoprotein protein MPP10 [Cricetulus griseus]ERE78248.1 U3 small nucleolar ribonucleoprotein MPP10 [Cricetulus griseus]
MAPRVTRRQTLERCLKEVNKATNRPECFLTIQNGLASNFTSLTKVLYDFNKILENGRISGSPLQKLEINNFDDEQIWQQLELQNEPVLQYFQNAVSETIEDEDLSLLPESEDQECEEDASEVEQEVESQEKLETDAEEEQLSDVAADAPKVGQRDRSSTKPDPRKSPVFSDEDSDLDFDISKLEQQTKMQTKPPGKPREKSVVDDKFFKLSEMESFLEKVEKEEEKRPDDEEEEEEIDFFEDIDSDEDEGGLFGRQKIKSSKSSRNLKYKDFFNPVESDDDIASVVYDDLGSNKEEEFAEEAEESISEMDEDNDLEESEGGEQLKEGSKRVTFALPEDEAEDTSPLAVKQESDEVKSSFEKRQEKMNEKIASLEKELLEKKPWQLQGEVTAQKRPENSLLEETLHFDHAVRMAPVITEETTLHLEDIIKQRIRDQAWDDVERKEKPKEDAYEYKKRLTLDHEKSKLSLAEIYEQEYIKLNQQKTEEEENPEHVEIEKMMDSLFLQLDALSNFHFIPKPPVPEIKVVSNLPAITMEEVAPVSVSDAALLAPEEIKEKNKAGDIKTAAEKTATDKKRERRKKKYQKHLKIKEKEKRRKLLEKKNPDQPGKSSRAAATEKLKQLTKTGKVSLLKDERKDKPLKSSQAFFSKLQDQVKMQINEAKQPGKIKKKKQDISVHKLKL